MWRRMMMARKAMEILTDFDLDLEDSTMMDTVPQDMTTQAPVSVDLGDFSEFEQGIEDITLKSEENIKALIYGPNGTGKTTIAGTFPSPVLILDVNERGTRVLASDDGKCKKRAVDTFEMFVQAYWYLRSGKHNFKTVVIDNVTTLQEVAMRYIMNKEADFELSKDMDMPTRRDWGGLSQIMKRWLIDFRNLPMNVVFIAQEKRDKEEDLDSDDSSVYPQVTPSVRAILGAAVDIIGRTYVNEAVNAETGKTKLKFCLRIAPGPTYLAKIRLPIGAQTPKSIVNPTYDALIKIMNGGYKPKGESNGEI
jgi:phage nucleotide-binding protein